MAGYLQSWLADEREQPRVPRGIFAGARRFLTQALEGIALDLKQAKARGPEGPAS